MFIEHEDPAIDAEKVEETTEQTTEQVEQIETPAPKTFTQEEVDEIVGKRIARNTAKIRREYDQKYGRLESVLKAGTGKEDVTEMTNTFEEFYKSKGIEMPQEPTYSDRDLAILARAEAEDIIKSGFDEVVEEVERLAGKGVQNMTAREKALFKNLAEYRQNNEQIAELSKIGVTEDVYNSKDFKDFADKFKGSGTSVTEIYEIYAKTKPRKSVQTMGSMRGGQESKVKDFYTPEEIARLTEADLDNDEVWEAVRRSMTGKS